MSKLKIALDHAQSKTELSHKDIMSIKRSRKHVDARYHVIKMLKDDFGLSYSHIGRLMNKDHTTIMHVYERGIASKTIRPDYEKEIVIYE